MPQSARLRSPGASITRSTPSRSSESDAAAARCNLDDGTPLVGVQVGEHPRVGAERVTVGWLDLDHVGPEVGEDLAAPPRGHSGPELDDPQVAQRLAHDVPSRTQTGVDQDQPGAGLVTPRSGSGGFTPLRRTRPGWRPSGPAALETE